MRKILFRGKRKDNGEWVQGYYVSFAGRAHYIYSGRYSDYDAVRYEVDKETISEFSGLKDKNGNFIFEGDIVYFGGKVYFEVAHYDFQWQLKCFGVYKHRLEKQDSAVFEVCGNKWDNAELLEKK